MCGRHGSEINASISHPSCACSTASGLCYVSCWADEKCVISQSQCYQGNHADCWTAADLRIWAPYKSNQLKLAYATLWIGSLLVWAIIINSVIIAMSAISRLPAVMVLIDDPFFKLLSFHSLNQSHTVHFNTAVTLHVKRKEGHWNINSKNWSAKQNWEYYV